MQNLEFQPDVSPTLVQIRRDSGQPDLCANVACHDCPLAIWYATGAGIADLRCSCTAMHREIWSADFQKRGFEIKRCDARDGAVAELEKESSI